MFQTIRNMSRRRKQKKIIKEFLKEVDWTPKEMDELNTHLWSLNTSIALLVYIGTRKMQKYGSSYPSELTPEEWRQILSEISEGMKLYLNEDDWIELWIDDKEEYEKIKSKIDNALSLVEKWFYTLWD